MEAPKTGDVSDLQYYYDRCLPGNSTVLNEFDAVTMQLTDIKLNVKDCRLDFSKSVAQPKESPVHLQPVLRTACEKKRQTGLLENLVAMIKRNFNAPELNELVDVEDTARMVVDKFFEYYCIDNVSTESVCGTMTKHSIQEWIAKQDPCKLGQLADFNFVDLPPVDVYRHMIKSQPKQKLDTSIQSEYPALQTIVFHPTKVNAIFGPLYSELTSKLLSMIDSSRFMLYTRKTPEDIQNFFSDLDSHQQLDILELDISKYDKSQNEFHCAIEYEIWRRLGIDDYLAEVWKQGHRRTSVSDYQAGIKTVLWYQRKSGDVTTFIGNTVIIAACLASMLPMNRAVKAAFCGDDSLVYFPSGVDVSNVQSVANMMWNFEAKLYMKKYGYFCGRYIIHHDRGAYVYYDPLKLISKLGNKSILDYDHLEEFRVSLWDVSKSLNNCAYYPQLNSAIRETIKTADDGSYAFKCVCKYLSDKALFKSLFIGNGTNQERRRQSLRFR